jgi:hypothetical protein
MKHLLAHLPDILKSITRQNNGKTKRRQTQTSAIRNERSATALTPNKTQGHHSAQLP